MPKNRSTRVVLSALQDFKNLRDRVAQKGKGPGFMEETGRGRKKTDAVSRMLSDMGIRLKDIRDE